MYPCNFSHKATAIVIQYYYCYYCYYSNCYYCCCCCFCYCYCYCYYLG